MNSLFSLITKSFVIVSVATALFGSATQGEEWKVIKRYQEEVQPDSGRYYLHHKAENWDLKKTAVIVCDMWDLHHCKNAVLREEELIPRMNQLIVKLREKGGTIIHAPSSCMAFYEQHPARKHAQETPLVASLPPLISNWCYKIPEEERGFYPVDQTDGGEDDDPQEHQKWAEELSAKGLNPKAPWTRQHPGLEILDQDYISDRGDEIWSILTRHELEHVIVMGVHTNMCVLGRPFGLRNLAQYGKDVVLMRDMTDTMYNPLMPPYVSHFSGTDLIIEHIEKYVCPTVSSDQFLGGKEFRFKGDNRPHIVIAMAEPEYKTEIGLTEFARKKLQHDYRVTFVYGRNEGDGDLPGIQLLPNADLLILSIRRRPISETEMRLFKEFVEAGKPILGIRTANHAFSLRTGSPPPGRVVWDRWDQDVFGGNYTNHYGAELEVVLKPSDSTSLSHPILRGIDLSRLQPKGSLYRVAPLESSAKPLLWGAVQGKPAEPLVWTNIRRDGGKSLYTSLGHEREFEQPEFIALLENSVKWCLEK